MDKHKGARKKKKLKGPSHINPSKVASSEGAFSPVVFITNFSELTCVSRDSSPCTYLHCPQCPQAFCTPEMLKEHAAVHAPVVVVVEDGLVCVVCGYNAPSTGRLNSHYNLHAIQEMGVRIYRCSEEDCNFMAETRIGVTIHKRLASHPVVRHKCEMCSYKSAYLSNVKSHVAKIHSKRKFKCPYCSETYIKGYRLKDHIQLCHVDESTFKRYTCHLCGYAATTNTDISSHTNAHSARGTTYKCSNCCFISTRFDKFAQHLMESLHGKAGVNTEIIIKSPDNKVRSGKVDRISVPSVTLSIVESNHISTPLVEQESETVCVEVSPHNTLNGEPTPIPCDEDPTPIPCDEYPLLIPCDEDPLPIPCEEDPTSIPCDEDHLDIPCEEDPLDIPCDEDHLDIPCDEDPLDIPCEEDPKPIPYEEDPKPIPVIRVVQKKEFGNFSKPPPTVIELDSKPPPTGPTQLIELDGDILDTPPVSPLTSPRNIFDKIGADLKEKERILASVGLSNKSTKDTLDPDELMLIETPAVVHTPPQPPRKTKLSSPVSRYTCRYCSTKPVFRTVQMLREHHIKAHGIRDLGVQFEANPRTYKCKYCTVKPKFESMKHLKDHYAKFHPKTSIRKRGHHKAELERTVSGLSSPTETNVFDILTSQRMAASTASPSPARGSDALMRSPTHQHILPAGPIPGNIINPTSSHRPPPWAHPSGIPNVSLAELQYIHQCYTYHAYLQQIQQTLAAVPTLTPKELEPCSSQEPSPLVDNILKYNCLARGCSYSTKLLSSLKHHITSKHNIRITDTMLLEWEDQIRKQESGTLGGETTPSVQATPDNKTYKCNLCSNVSISFDELVMHIKNAHGLSLGIGTPTQQDPTQSTAEVSETSSQPVQCMEIVATPKVTETVPLSEPGIFECGSCYFVGRSALALMRHERIHSGIVYQCRVCNYEAYTHSSLKSHSKIHLTDG